MTATACDVYTYLYFLMNSFCFDTHFSFVFFLEMHCILIILQVVLNYVYLLLH